MLPFMTLQLDFSNAAHSWPDIRVSEVWAKKKLPLQINFIHLSAYQMAQMAQWYLSKSVCNKIVIQIVLYAQWEQCFMNIQKDSICYSILFPREMETNCKCHTGKKIQPIKL